MSINRVKVIKSKLARDEMKKKIVALQFKLRKVKAEKMAVVEVCQENTEVFENVEKALKLDIENVQKKMNDVVTRHNKLLEKISESVECPVCMEIPRSGPVSVCQNGHLVCNKCKAGSCPTCRVGMGNGKSLVAITVIENIDHKCKFVECEELFAVEKLDAHEKICRYRTVKCPASSCKAEIALSNLLDHFVIKTCCYNPAPTVIDPSSKTGKVSFQITDFLSKENKSVTWKLWTFSYRGTNFVISSSKSGVYYHFTMVMFESKEVCSKFKIEMEVHERNPSDQSSDISIKFCGSPCSIDETKDQVKFRGLTVHHEVMKEMTRQNEDLTFSVSFSFSEKRGREPDGLE